MSFTAFSKEFTANMYTNVENAFITKYLPWADGDAVRAYLYGLYLCACRDEFDAGSAAKLLKIQKDRFLQIFEFWEECGLVHILSKDPLYLEYLPVSAAVGKPKPMKAEKYADFNRELLKRLQKAGKDFRPYQMQKILEFLENERMEPQAFLLVVESCIKTDGEKFGFLHVMNKAKKLAAEHKFTYEQVEETLLNFNQNEQKLLRLFSLLGIYRKPQESDFALYEKWIAEGFSEAAVEAGARSLKKGSLSSLDALLSELKDKNIFSNPAAQEYFARREALLSFVFSAARRLGVKVQSPRVYLEEYAEKWTAKGYSPESLLCLSSLSFRLGYGFSEMDALVDSLERSGVPDGEVKSYVAAREKQLKILKAVQGECGMIPKTIPNLDAIGNFLAQGFDERTILQAAKRAAGASAPLPYMAKLLSEWKKTGKSAFGNPQSASSPAARNRENLYKSEAAIAADRKTDREHYYAILRQRAQSAAEATRKKAMESDAFREADGEVKKGEIELARAEVFERSAAGECRKKLEAAKSRRIEALRLLGLSPEDLEPKYRCPKCSDTGFLSDGRPCDCYPKEGDYV